MKAHSLLGKKSGHRKFGDPDRRWLLRSQDYKCSKCGAKLNIRNVHCEEITPSEKNPPSDIEHFHAICSKCYNKHHQ